jgi:hypothetical protein
MRPRLRHTGIVRTLLVVVAAFVVSSSLGCGPAAKPDPVGPVTRPPDDPTCPVLVNGTSVTVEDTDTGAALVFVTTGDAAAVRTRARALADAHNAHHAKMAAPAEGAPDPHAGHGGGSAADPHAGHGAAGQTSSMGTMISTHSTAAMTELPTGARVTFTAHDPAAIQTELRMHAQHLAGGSCVM